MEKDNLNCLQRGARPAENATGMHQHRRHRGDSKLSK